MATKTAVLARDNTSRQLYGSGNQKKGKGKDDRLLMGQVKIEDQWWRVRSFLKFTLDGDFWDGVEVVTSAELTLTTANNVGGSELAPGSGAKVAVTRLTKAFSEGSHSAWSDDDYEWPSHNSDKVAIGQGSETPETSIDIDMFFLLRQVAPKRIAFRRNGENIGNGLADKDANEYGWMLRGYPEGERGAATEVWSGEKEEAVKRPTLTIIYEQVNEAPTAGLTALGDVTADFEITGTFTDTNINDHMTQVQWQVEKNSVGNWDTPIEDLSRYIGVSIVDDMWHIADDDWDKSKLVKDTEYKLRARVFDKYSKPSAWVERTFTIVADAPTVTAESFGSITTLSGVMLGGAFTVDALTEPLTVDIRVYADTTLKWSHSYPITQGEKDSSVIAVEYGGPTLVAETYQYGVRLTDKLGGQSEWSEDGTFTLTADAPDTEGTLANVTGYSPIAPATRIVLYSMDPANRGPKDIVGIIEDAANIGVSWYASSPGQLYFTLPVTHPQVSVCEPMTTHYQFQQYRRGRWHMLAAGLIYDFDAKDTDMVVYGMDYLGLLSWSIEAAVQPTSNYKKDIPTKVSGVNGSRYNKKTIKFIIKNQLERAQKQDPHSPVKFIEVGDLGDFDTKVTIYASYVERLAFIRGLIDSHKGAITTGGGERRSRLRVRYNKTRKRWVFDALDAAGSDRDNIRLEYGSLLQGYQVIALGDYANLIYGSGKEPNKLKPHFNKQAAPGVSQSDWGSIGRAAFWGDVTDNQDLARRARAEAIRSSRVGKKLALGLRVNGLAIFDGYDLLDSLPIDINDGVVDTSQYGSGYWTIWGAEYRVYSDGHDEVTLIVRPRGDGAAIDTDLIHSDPIHAQVEWTWGSGAPTG